MSLISNSSFVRENAIVSLAEVGLSLLVGIMTVSAVSDSTELITLAISCELTNSLEFSIKIESSKSETSVLTILILFCASQN